MPRPSFFDSEWFVMEPDNWHLKDGAPKDIVDEFNEYIDNPDVVENVDKNGEK